MNHPNLGTLTCAVIASQAASAISNICAQVGMARVQCEVTCDQCESPSAPPSPYGPPPTSPPPLYPGNDSYTAPPPSAPGGPTACDLGTASCWSCDYAELEISYFIPGAALEDVLNTREEANGPLNDMVVANVSANASDGLGSDTEGNASETLYMASGRVFFTNVRPCSSTPRFAPPSACRHV